MNEHLVLQCEEEELVRSFEVGDPKAQWADGAQAEIVKFVEFINDLGLSCLLRGGSNTAENEKAELLGLLLDLDFSKEHGCLD